MCLVRINDVHYDFKLFSRLLQTTLKSCDKGCSVRYSNKISVSMKHIKDASYLLRNVSFRRNIVFDYQLLANHILHELG